jgi:hypothetical protein
MATYPACRASWHSPYDWEYTVGLLRATWEWSQRGEYPCMLGERVGPAAVVATERYQLMGSLNDSN